MKSLYEVLVKHNLKANDISSEEKSKIDEYTNSRFWDITIQSNCHKDVIYNFEKQGKNIYLNSEGNITVGRNGDLSIIEPNIFFEYNINRYNRIDHKDCPLFTWNSHKGTIIIPNNLQAFESIEGLPDEIDTLFIGEMVACHKREIKLGNRHIKKIRLNSCGHITLSGPAKVDEITWFGYDGKKPNITFNCKNMHRE